MVRLRGAIHPLLPLSSSLVSSRLVSSSLSLSLSLSLSPLQDIVCIFKSVKQEDGSWSEAQNLGYPINTPGDEVDFTLTADGKTAYYSTKGSVNGKFDIMKIDLSNYPLVAPAKIDE